MTHPEVREQSENTKGNDVSRQTTTTTAFTFLTRCEDDDDEEPVDNSQD